MNFKYNRKLGVIVLVLVIALSLAIGFSKASRKSDPADPQVPSYGGSAAVYDHANVLSAASESLIDLLSDQIYGTIWVFTETSIGSLDSNAYLEDAASTYGIRDTRDMVLILVTEQDKYWFAYGSEYWDALDGIFNDLMDEKFAPDYYRGDYEDAVIALLGSAVDAVNERGSSAGGPTVAGFSSMILGEAVSMIALIFFFVILFIVLLVSSLVGRRRRSYGYYDPWYIPYSGPRYRSGFGYRPPRGPSGPRPGSSSPFHSGSSRSSGGSVFHGGGSSRSSGSSAFHSGGRSSSSRSSGSSGFHGGGRSGGSRSSGSSGFHGGGKR